MNRCPHMEISERFSKQINHIKQVVSDCKLKNTRLCCSGCQRRKNLFVALECGTVLCIDHLHITCPERHAHVLFFDIERSTLYCCQCNAYLLMSDNEIRQHVRLTSARSESFGYFALKRFSDFGQTSHLGVLLQIMMNEPRFRDHFFSFHHSSYDCADDCCPDCFFKEIYSQVYSPNPVDLSDAIYCIARREQNHEALDDGNVQRMFELLCNMYHSRGQSTAECECVMHSVFFGTLCTTERCSVCKNTTSTARQFISLSLRSHYNLAIALAEFLAPTISDEQLYCRQCTNSVPAYRLAVVEHFPKVLALYFDKFVLGVPGKKNTNKMHVDDKLNVQGVEYHLYAFIEHKGIRPGHYIGYVLLSDEWYEFNNEKVIRNVNVSLRLPNALMVFYAQAEDSG